MHIPTEILQKILREATVVPEAFDTSFDAVLHESRDAVLKAIQVSMFTKTALALVSQLFCGLVYEFLYEIISIHRFKWVPVLSKLVQAPPRYGSRRRARGHLCRRLEICLGMGPENYNDTAWYEGGHTLWGLVAACPNIHILICRVWAKDTKALPAVGRPTCPHLTHPSLWRLIASTCGPRLLRMELFGFCIRMDRVEMMLRYCTKLEVCRLVHVRAYSDGKDDYDGREPRTLPTSWARSWLWAERDRTGGRPSGLFDASAKREFSKAKYNACWPACSLEAPYTLPSLHTFHIDAFNRRITELDMPKLRHLGLFVTKLQEWTEMKEDILASCLSFPVSLTHVSLGRWDALPLEVIVNAFPTIKELCLHYSQEGSPDQWSAIKVPHGSLGVVKYACHGHGQSVMYHIRELLLVVQSRRLPALREVSVLRWGKKAENDDELPFEQFRALGVALEVELVQPFGRYEVGGRVRDPVYTCHQ